MRVCSLAAYCYLSMDMTKSWQYLPNWNTQAISRPNAGKIGKAMIESAADGVENKNNMIVINKKRIFFMLMNNINKIFFFRMFIFIEL